MILNELRDKAYKCACEHGFHETEYSNEHWFMLTIGEVAEMVEADRKNMYPDVEAFKDSVSDVGNSDVIFKDAFEKYIKNTVYDEMADVVIRLLDYAGLNNQSVVLMPHPLYERERLIPISEAAYIICQVLTSEKWRPNMKTMVVIDNMFLLSEMYNVDLMWFIKQKMRYNRLRPRLNGKRY